MAQRGTLVGECDQLVTSVRQFDIAPKVMVLLIAAPKKRGKWPHNPQIKSGNDHDAAQMIGMPWPEAKSRLKTAASSKSQIDHSLLFVRGGRAPFDTAADEF